MSNETLNQGVAPTPTASQEAIEVAFLWSEVRPQYKDMVDALVRRYADVTEATVIRAALRMSNDDRARHLPFLTLPELRYATGSNHHQWSQAWAVWSTTLTVEKTHTRMYDRFYPSSDSVYNAATCQTVAAIGWEPKLREHLAAAILGDRERESKLINRLGQIRRMVPQMSLCSRETRQCLRECKGWLEAVGRKFDFLNVDPALWISRRGGGPRW